MASLVILEGAGAGKSVPLQRAMVLGREKADVVVADVAASREHCKVFTQDGDWFVLDLLVLALVFVPLERAFALVRSQRILRAGWRTDLAHFFASHLLVQVLALLTIAPAELLLGGLVPARLQAAVAALPLAVQVLLAVAAADLFQYWIHRAFHAFPALWRFHAIHHSSEEMERR